MKKTIGIIAAVVILIIGLFIWWKPLSAPEKAPEETTGTEFNLDKITANHFFKDGTHTLEGRITLPTPCYSLTSSARVAESMPEQVTVDFVAKKTSDVCTQVIDEKIFSVNFKASEKAVIGATFNGKPVILDLIEGGSVKGDAIEKL